MAKFIYQSKKIQKKNDPLPFPQKKKKHLNVWNIL